MIGARREQRALDPHRCDFEPLRPASRGRLIAAFVFGPMLWLAALIVAAWLLDYTGAIELRARDHGRVVRRSRWSCSGCCYAARRREEKRYAERR